MREIRVGEKVRVINKESPLYDKIVSVVKVAWGSATVRIPRDRKTHLVLDTDIEFAEPEKLTMATKRDVLKRFVKSASLVDPVMFKVQIGSLNRLFTKYPDREFWLSCEPEYTVESLTWYEEGGSNDLYSLYKKFNLDFKVKRIVLSETKLCPDSVIPAKPKTTEQWLKEK